MSIMIAAIALAASPTPAAVQAAPGAAPPRHAQHAHAAKPGDKPRGEGCSCCKKMEGGKMACCSEHGKGQARQHSGHDASH